VNKTTFLPNDTEFMKFALLSHPDSEEFSERGKDPALKAAGVAYVEALQAAGVMVGGAGLRPPQTATVVSVRDGKQHVHDGPDVSNDSDSLCSLHFRVSI
jgi:hypothetical protein